MSFIQDDNIPNGLYYIQNVSRKSWIGLPQPQKELCATLSPVHGWRITLKSNNKYDIQSCPGGFFAQCEPRPKAGNFLFVQPEHFEWVVKQVSEVSAPDCYWIYPSENPRVMWSLRDSEESTPIEFALIESNQKNWWMFKLAHDDEPDPFITNPGAMTGLVDQLQNANIEDLAQTRANIVSPRFLVLLSTPTHPPAVRLMPNPPTPHSAPPTAGGTPGSSGRLLHPNKAARNDPSLSRSLPPQINPPRSKYRWLERDLEGKHPAYRHERLASSFHVHALNLSAAGYLEEASESIEKAVQIRRHIAKHYSEISQRNLVSSLIVQSRCLGDSGRPAEALSAAEAGTTMHRKIGNNEPERSDPELAAALCALAEARRRMCKRVEAIDAAQQSVRIFRILSNTDHETYSPNLATALRILSCCLRDIGRFDQAQREIQQSVDIFDEHPGSYETDLADALSIQAGLLYYQYRGQEGLNLVRRSITLYQFLPQMFKPGLVKSLIVLADLQGQVGYVDEAVTSIKDAVRIQEELASENPTAHNETLGGCYITLSIRLSGLFHMTDALEAAQNSVHIFRSLVSQCDKAYKAGLMDALGNLSNMLLVSNPVRIQEAVNAANEALKIWQVLEVYAGNVDDFFKEGACACDAMARSEALNRKPGLSLNLVTTSLKHYIYVSASNPKAYSWFLADAYNEQSG
ncbi:hypothetical protein BD410DRAFT_294979 [Rickenella mellea]|uniref:TPR-like protein n=1 Tax=Rickenella mellea TaxID=50990 RepID=A0A4Y7Q3Z6_9AGAM|nr:hypothetical protein BD410DRAFT_294979 [Rickenella mellea]